MLSDSAGTGTACEVGDDGVNWRRCAPRSILSGVAVGLLTGLFGVGGGFLIIPALVLILGRNADRGRASTTSSTGRQKPCSAQRPHGHRRARGLAANRAMGVELVGSLPDSADCQNDDLPGARGGNRRLRRLRGGA